MARRDNDKLRQELLHEFKNACAYCGTTLGSDGPVAIDHFRPQRQFPDLADTPTNLLPSCAACNSSKSDKFPVDAEGSPLLLNPRVDSYEEHIKFEPDGLALGLTPRGEATIKILNLNRAQLIEQRAVNELLKNFEQAVALLSSRQPADEHHQVEAAARKERIAALRAQQAAGSQPTLQSIRREYESFIADQKQRVEEAERRAASAEASSLAATNELEKILRDPQVRIAEIRAQVDQLKIEKENETALRKIEAEERATNLQIELKRLEGESALSVAREQGATQRAVAAEKEFERLKLQKDTETERLKIEAGKYAERLKLLAAGLTVLGGIIGAILGRITAKPDDFNKTTPAPSASSSVSVGVPPSLCGKQLIGTKAGAQSWSAANCPSGSVFHEFTQCGGDAVDLRQSPVLVWECIDASQRKQGKSVGWYDGSDRTALEWTYHDGQLEGEHRQFTKSGVLRQRSLYAAGRLSGWRIEYDDFGRFARAECFENGVRVGSTVAESELTSPIDPAFVRCAAKSSTPTSPSAAGSASSPIHP